MTAAPEKPSGPEYKNEPTRRALHLLKETVSRTSKADAPTAEVEARARRLIKRLEGKEELAAQVKTHISAWLRAHTSTRDPAPTETANPDWRLADYVAAMGNLVLKQQPAVERQMREKGYAREVLVEPVIEELFRWLMDDAEGGQKVGEKEAVTQLLHAVLREASLPP